MELEVIIQPAIEVTFEIAKRFEIVYETPGPQGIRGLNGASGPSAYTIAVTNGFVGNEAAWLASLKGEDGDAGSGTGGSRNKRSVATSQTLLADDGIVNVTGSANVELTLPSPIVDDIEITVKKFNSGTLIIRGVVDGITDFTILNKNAYTFYSLDGAYYVY